MSEATVVGALELGGTHISSARVAIETREVEPGTLRRTELRAGASRDELLEAIRDAARGVADARTHSWGVAVPGPFDHERGVALLRGMQKLDALYGADLGAELAGALGVARDDVRFLNDAAAFLLGEWWAGAARGQARAVGITLGSGLGSAFLRDGAIAVDGDGVPPASRLDLVLFHERAAEETISRRGLMRLYGAPGVEPAEIAGRARGGELHARDAFTAFGAALGAVLTPWLAAFGADALVVGGSISRAWDLFGAELLAACPPAQTCAYAGVAARLDEAPLIGAALHAVTRSRANRA